MKFTFYLKLALTNLKKNRETYFPYFLACLGTIFMYFLFVSFAYNEGLQNISGRDMVYSLFLIGKIVVIVFAVIFIFYANSFLMKRRKKEIGLYSILGFSMLTGAVLALCLAMIASLFVQTEEVEA